MKIVFFGTPKFAEIVLQKLIKQDDFDVVGVVCAPDKPIGRKKVLTSPPVKVLAEKNKIPVLQPEKLNTEFVNKLKKFKVDVFVVAAYGKIIPQKILDLPKFGAINIHPSVLPKYRGASPIQTALLNGDTETGVTIMEMDEEMDHGKIVKSEKLKVKSDARFKELHDKLAKISAEMLIEILPKYVAGEIKPVEQNHAEATYCKIIKKSNGEIDWNKSAQEIYNMWRAFEEWPKAFGKKQETRNKRQGLLKYTLIEIDLVDSEKFNFVNKQPGEFFVEDKKLFIMCGDGNVLEILKIQPEGKNVMDAMAFVNGYLK